MRSDRRNARGFVPATKDVFGGAFLRQGPRLRDVLSGCNRRAWRYSKHVDVAADHPEWIDNHATQETLPLSQLWIRRLLASLILLPLGMVFLVSLIVLMGKAGSTPHLWLSVPVWYTIMGVLIWTILYFGKTCYTTFLFLYVYGHELTHWLFIFFSGGKVSAFKVSLEGGHVITNKNNLLIALSPYFFPIWVIAWLLLAAIVSLFVPWNDLAPVVFGGLGFWWAFHFYWTIWIIPKDQPDLNENGTFFSLMVIYLSNLVLITFFLMLCGAVSPRGFVNEFVIQGHGFFSLLGDLVRFLFNLFR